MKTFLLTFFISLPFLLTAQFGVEPGGFVSFGFTGRTAKPSGDEFNIRYFNTNRFSSDTFTFKDNLSSSACLVNFAMSIGYAGKYGGVSGELGFVPFANRNKHFAANAFALIHVNERLTLAPSIGYTRYRKHYRLGVFETENDTIVFRNVQFRNLILHALDVYHSYNIGLGAIYNFDKTTALFFDVKYCKTFYQTSSVRVRGLGGDKLVESMFASEYEYFRQGDKEISVTSGPGNMPADHFFDVRNLAFSVRLVLMMGDGRNGYSPKKFMGTQ